MKLHVAGLPHTNFTPKYSWCAYTTKISKFAKMMSPHLEVITYGNGEAELPGKYVKIDDTQYEDFFVPNFDSSDWVFSHFNNRAIAAIIDHIGVGDVICLAGGTAQKPIADALSSYPTVEFGIGYTGVFADFRVFESHAWEAHVLGITNPNGMQERSKNDAVIPNYFEPDDFQLGSSRGYFAFLGRVTKCKGVDLAIAAAKEAGVPLKVAGQVFDDSEYVKELSGDIEYVGNLDPAERKTFLSEAVATLCPTNYLEPFCGVHVESLLSGTPVIVPDYGAFVETVTQGFNGWRCRTLSDYVTAVFESDLSDDQRRLIRRDAIHRFSLESVAPLYLNYFDRIMSVFES